MHHTINIMPSQQEPLMTKQMHDLAVADLSCAYCYSKTLVGPFQVVKKIC